MFEPAGYEIRNRSFSFAPRDTDNDHIPSRISIHIKSENSAKIVVKYSDRRVESNERTKEIHRRR